MLIKKANQQNVAKFERLQEGEGIFNLATVIESADKTVGFHYNIMAKDASIGKHYHSEETEYYYIIRGEAEYDDNGTMCTLRAGDIAACKGGEYHAVRAISDEFIFVGIISIHR